MRYVLTNGIYYIKMSDTGKVIKTADIEEAQHYHTVEKAAERMKKTPGRCKGYYVLDMETNRICSKRRRKKYSHDARKMIYNKSNGHCALCGKKIQYKSMTVDHIIPLAMGGDDILENLQCACQSCNQYKSDILPEAFMERITGVFMYQMDKQYGSRIRWKIINRMLENMI